MAVKAKKKNVKTIKKSLPSPFNNYWQKSNYTFFSLGILVIVLGFYFMSLGEWNSTSSLIISPILLIIGFVIIIPFSIFYKKKNEQVEEIKIEK